MKLSIIVPVYNAEKYLHQCVDSLLAQQVDSYEIILVDDGSRDSSGQILEAYRKEYPQKIKTVTLVNGGQGRARNIGLSMAQGEYVGFVDSDDFVEPDMYKKLLDCAETEKADIAICNFKRLFEDGSEENWVSWDENKPLLAAGSCCDKLFRRELIADIRYPEGLWYEDFSFSAKLLMKAEKIVHVNECLYVYRCGQVSTMNNSNTVKNLDMLTVMSDLKDFMQQYSAKDGFEFLLINHVLLDAVNRVAKHNTSDREEVISKLRSFVKENIPDLFASESFKKESRNRRIIMALNYYGLHKLSKMILKIKSA